MKNRDNALRLPAIRRLRIAVTASSNVRSGCSAISANNQPACFSKGETLPPLGFAAELPSSLQRRSQLITELGLTSKSAATSCREAPPSTIAIARTRRSSEYGLAITLSFQKESRAPDSLIRRPLGIPRFEAGGICSSSEDRNHPLKKVIIVPLSEDAPSFAKRFGVDAYTLYNMTEISTPLVSELNPTKIGSCGQARAGVELRLVNENDCEVAIGSVGELIVRSDTPWTLNSGYFKNPEATAAAWRNGWFHTGDAFRKDAEGTFYFVDRMKDAIRRRGENISSFEVEAEIAAHPAITEVAVIPVPSEIAEEEVMCVVALIPGQSFDPKDLLTFLESRLAHFMLPRYVRIVDALPKTPTQKIQKHLLRAEGITADTWDREKAGIKIRRQQI